MYDAIDAPTESELRELEARYCSYGDTVHYLPDPKFFTGCEGSFMYDAEGREFLDLQMWYSAVNFGYRNPRLDAVAKRQLDTLPQVASSRRNSAVYSSGVEPIASTAISFRRSRTCGCFNACSRVLLSFMMMARGVSLATIGPYQPEVLN